VLKIWENVETRCAQTPTFPDPNFSALQARSPDWGAQAQRTPLRKMGGLDGLGVKVTARYDLRYFKIVLCCWPNGI
jgi:hypothetical protein